MTNKILSLRNRFVSLAVVLAVIGLSLASWRAGAISHRLPNAPQLASAIGLNKETAFAAATLPPIPSLFAEALSPSLPSLMQQPASCGASFAQATGSPISVGNNPRSVAIGDFNLDGKPDLATANANSNNVTILLGNGSGGFAQPAGSPVGAGTGPVSVAIGDFNLDGKPDLAVANYFSNNVTILLGNGVGGFTQPAASPVGAGSNPSSVVVGDFNLDSKPDLAVTNQGSNNVTLLLGNGAGGFTQSPGSPFTTGGEPVSVAVGDFNLDGRSDLTVANVNSNNVTILLGDGAGSFTQPATSPVAVGTTPYSVAVRDFNLDGKPDLATANFSSDNVTILVGNGTGGFTQSVGSPVPIAAGSRPYSVATGDFNLDGKPDFAVSSNGSGDVTIQLGDGAGGFAQPATSPVSAGGAPLSLAVGDFNLDGKSDLATANFSNDNVTILLNNCAPTIVASTVTQQQGTAATLHTIAAVNDVETPKQNLVVTAMTVPSGISVTSISSPNATTGEVTATIAADCTATLGNNTIVLKVTDGGGLTMTANLVVNVTANTAPTLSYNNPPTLIFSNGATINPATGPSDNGSVASIAVQSVMPSPASGTITVNNSSGVVTVPNNIPAGIYTVAIRATDNCGSPSGVTDASFTLTVQPIDYIVTTTGNAIVVTDVSGNGDTLSITEPSGGNIKFAAAGRNFQINGATTISGDSGNLPLVGVNSITVNQGNGSDIANVGAFAFNLPSLTINGGVGDDTVNLNGDITFAANANLDVDLQNDSALPGIDTVFVNDNANLIATGAGTITINVSRTILLFSGSSLNTANGGITMLANVAGTTVDNVFGIRVRGGTVNSGAGNLVMVGFAGVGSGVVVDDNGLVTSYGGNVSVNGNGGGSADDSTKAGVFVQSGEISAGGNGTVTVLGNGSATTIGNYHIGVRVCCQNGRISSSGGDVMVSGTGNGSGSSFGHTGVQIDFSGQITAGGNGTVTVVGFGGTTSTSGSTGILIDGQGGNSQITSSGGNVVVTASSGTGTFAAAIDVGQSASISTAANGGSITIVADSMSISPSASIGANNNSSVTLNTRTNDQAIGLGAADNFVTLGLTDGELDRVTAGTLNIGNANSGAITVSAAMTRTAATVVNLTSGGAINLNASSLDSAGGNVSLTPGTLVNPAAVGGDVSMSATGILAFGNGADLAIAINGTTPDVQHTQLNVAGGVNLNGVDLLLSGVHLPVVGQSFVIVNNDGTDAIIGAFNGLPQSALIPNFLGSGLNAQISYMGGTGNDVVLTAISPILSVSKSAPAPALAIGQNSTYTISVANNGNAAATTATVKEAIPSGFDLISAVGANWICSPASGSDPVGIVTCNFSGGSIAVSGVATTIAVTVKPKASFCGASATNRVSVDPTGGINAPNPTTCTALNSPTAGCGAPIVSPVTNNAPTLSYNNATVNSGATITVNPVTGPADDGSVASIAVQSVGSFNGTVTVNNLGVVSISNTGSSGTINPNHPTEVISLSNAGTCGVFTITIRITDNCGQNRDAAFTLTANDTLPPVLGACPSNISQPATNGSCAAVVTYTPPSANDNCGAPTVTCVPSSGATFNLGTTTVTCTARDGANNSVSCSFTVTINDAQAPTIAACTPNISANTDNNQCVATVTYAVPTATDNCAGTPTVTCSPASGSSFAKGTTTVTCTATDAAKNSSQCAFTVTVTDGQNPTITCPANQTALSTDGNPVTVTYPAPTASDNCAGVTTACVPASGSSFAVGTTTVTCTATDAASRTANCSFTVMVGSCVGIVCPADISVATTATARVVNYSLPTANGVCGTITCSPASGSSFAVGVTTVNCSSSIGNQTCAFRVTVNRISGSANDPLVCTGTGNTVQATLVISNDGTVNQTVSDTTTFTNLVGVPGSCVVSPNVGICTVTNGSLTYDATLTPGQTVTLTYLTQVSNLAQSGAQVCTNNSVTFSGGPAFEFSVCDVIDCPAVGPGSPTTVGSVLIYNVYTSSTDPAKQNTRINVTNSHPRLPAFVHLFFVAESCSVADSYVCLTANQTTSFLSSDLDPGTTGYLVAVAVDARGCPTNFNYLLGDEYVKFASGHAANLRAEAFAAQAGGLPACDGNSVTAQLNFDGVSYNRLPAVLALSNVASRADGNDTLLIVNRIGGNLGIGASTLGALFGILYNDAESALSFAVAGNCQLRNSLSNNFPRTTPRFESFIPAGRTGWLKIFNQTGSVGITGAAINFNANAASSAGAFNQGHNLHALTLNATNGYTIPVFPPSC